MRTALALLAVAILTLTACAHAGDVVWHEVTHCGPSPQDLGQTVLQDLLQADAAQLLDDLVVKYGPDLVACLVDDAVAELTKHGAQASDEAVAGAERGRAYLAGHGVKKFERAQ